MLNAEVRKLMDVNGNLQKRARRGWMIEAWTGEDDDAFLCVAHGDRQRIDDKAPHPFRGMRGFAFSYCRGIAASFHFFSTMSLPLSVPSVRSTVNT